MALYDALNQPDYSRSAFDPQAYLAANPDVANSLRGDSLDPYRHWLEYGQKEGRAFTGNGATALANQDSLLTNGANWDHLGFNYDPNATRQVNNTAGDGYDPGAWETVHADADLNNITGLAGDPRKQYDLGKWGRLENVGDGRYLMFRQDPNNADSRQLIQTPYTVSADGHSLDRAGKDASYRQQGEWLSLRESVRDAGELAAIFGSMMLGGGAAAAQMGVSGATGLALGEGATSAGLSSAAGVGGTSAGLSSADAAALFGAEGYGAGMTAAEIEAATAAGATGTAGLSSAEAAALHSAEGYGAGMSGLQTSAYDGIMNLTGSGALANLGAQLSGYGGTAAQFLKDNPLAGKLLMSALTSGASASGGGGGGGGSAGPSGPPVAWGSALQRGLYATPKQVDMGGLGGALGLNGASRYIRG